MSLNPIARKGPRTEKGKAREHILEAAEQVYSVMGIAAATTKEIARVANVNEATLFRHFPAKQDLFRAVITKRSEEARAGQTELALTGDLAKDLVVFGTHQLRFFQQHNAFFRHLMLEIGTIDAEDRAFLQMIGEASRGAMVRFFEDMQAKGEVRPELDATRLTVAFSDWMKMIALRHGVMDCFSDTDEYLLEIITVFVRGIASDKTGKKSGAKKA